DADLAIAHIAGGAVVLLADASRMSASLEKAGFVDGHGERAAAQLLQHESAHLIAHPIDVPDGRREQALHAIRGGFAGLLSQLPAIFTLDGTEDALHKTQGARKGFGSGKVA